VLDVGEDDAQAAAVVKAVMDCQVQVLLIGGGVADGGEAEQARAECHAVEVVAGAKFSQRHLCRGPVYVVFVDDGR
jgi:hypothetical protein